jgi:hypothetical protein
MFCNINENLTDLDIRMDTSKNESHMIELSPDVCMDSSETEDYVTKSIPHITMENSEVKSHVTNSNPCAINLDLENHVTKFVKVKKCPNKSTNQIGHIVTQPHLILTLQEAEMKLGSRATQHVSTA